MVHRTIFRALRTPCGFSCAIRSNPRFAMVFSASLTLKTPCSPGLHRPSSPTGRGRFRPPGGKAARTKSLARFRPPGVHAAGADHQRGCSPSPGPTGPFVTVFCPLNPVALRVRLRRIRRINRRTQGLAGTEYQFGFSMITGEL